MNLRKVFVALVLLCGCRSDLPGPPGAVAREQIDARVRQYFTRVADLPDNVTLELTSLEPAPVAGWLQGELALVSPESRERLPLLVSADGHYLIQGELADLTVDPYAAAMAQISLAHAPRRGSPSAPVSIVAFVDFQCPFCARSMQTLERFVLPAYGDKVQLVVKHFPLASAHPWAEAAALAAACAFEQSPEAFWAVATRFFRDQETLRPDEIRSAASAALRAVAADGNAFGSCFDNQTGLAAVHADLEEGRRLGIRSTPTFFINGRKLEGARPFEELQAAVDAALADPASARRLAQNGGSPP